MFGRYSSVKSPWYIHHYFQTLIFFMTTQATYKVSMAIQSMKTLTMNILLLLLLYLFLAFLPAVTRHSSQLSLDIPFTASKLSKQIFNRTKNTLVISKQLLSPQIATINIVNQGNDQFKKPNGYLSFQKFAKVIFLQLESLCKMLKVR